MAVDVSSLVDTANGTVSRRIFIDQDLYEQELEQIFARCWLFLGHESQIPRPGNFITTYMGEDVVIVTRDTTGHIRGLLNSCPHRGNRVCRLDQGRAPSFMCTYHGWTFDLEGKLISVPGFEEVYDGELDRDQWGLIPVAQVDTYKGLIFGTFDPDAPPLDEYLGEETRWAMDVLLDQRPGGTELVGGVMKWIMNCNWKFGSDNFIGDVYHGMTTHRSASMVGHRTLGRGAEYTGSGGVFGKPGFSVRSPYGHGYNVDLRAPDDVVRDWREPLASYHQQTAPEVQRRLGTLRASEVTRINMTVFPNLSVSSSSSMLHVWHPRGPGKTEAWLYTLVDRNAPPDVKNAFRRASQRHFGPSGMFEQDDGENLEQGTLAALGTVARRYPLNYQMGMRHEDLVHDGNVPTRVPRRITEYTTRGFYARWAEVMAGKIWAPLHPTSPEPLGGLPSGRLNR